MFRRRRFGHGPSRRRGARIGWIELLNRCSRACRRSSQSRLLENHGDKSQCGKQGRDLYRRQQSFPAGIRSSRVGHGRLLVLVGFAADRVRWGPPAGRRRSFAVGCAHCSATRLRDAAEDSGTGLQKIHGRARPLRAKTAKGLPARRRRLADGKSLTTQTAAFSGRLWFDP
jgi:hypothetical protein